MTQSLQQGYVPIKDGCIISSDMSVSVVVFSRDAETRLELCCFLFGF